MTHNTSRKSLARTWPRALSAGFIFLVVLFALPEAGQRAVAGPRAILEGTYPLSSLQVLGECVNRLKERYFDPERIVPRKMVAASIESLQNNVTPLLVERIDDDETKGPSAILVKMGDEERRFELDEVKDLDRMVWTLMNAFQFIDAHLPPGADREVLETIATNAMLHTLDPHTTFLDPGSYRDMQVETSGLFGGLGIVISLVKGELTIISVMEETPAFQAGLNPRDKVVQIGDESTVNMELSEAVSRMRGKPGTDITIQVKRKGWEKAKAFTITRARITIRSVVSKLLDGNIGYVRLKNFRANTTEQLRLHLAKLQAEAKAPIKGVILDLRDDPGGFLEQAIRVADQFLKKGEIVRTIGAGNKVRDNRSARPQGKDEAPNYEETPIIVLINQGSASASEIVAGALKNHNRAILVGNRSFGKGTVQGIYELGDGAVKITIAEYLTPGGVPVHDVGVIPDIAIEAIDTSLDRMMIFSQKRLAHEDPPDAPLGSARWKAQQKKPLRTMRFVMEQEEDDEEARERRRFEYDVVNEKDFAIDLSARLLRASPHATADTMMRNATQTLKKIEARETKRLEGAMKLHNVDWSGGTQVLKPRLTATVEMDPPNGEVKAGEKLTIKVRLRNNGLKPLHRIHAIASSTTRMLEGREFLFGKIGVGQESVWETIVEPHSSAYERFDTMNIEFFQDNEPIVLHREILVAVRNPKRPSFEFTYNIDDAIGGNGDGRIQLGERVTLNINVHNRGDGSTAETTAALKNSAGEGVFLERGRKTVETPIKPGMNQSFAFTFDVRASLTTSKIPLEIQIRDRKNGISFRQRFSLPVHNASNEAVKKLQSPGMAKSSLILRGGASKSFPVVARLKAKTALKTVKKSGKWILVETQNKYQGWVKATDIKMGTQQSSLAQNAQAVMAFRPPEIIVDSPVDDALFSDSETLSLKGNVLFYKAGQALERKVTVFQDGRKIWFKTLRHKDEEKMVIKLDIPIALEKGQNRISIRAQEGNRVDMYETVFIHRGALEVTQ